ncbi:ABC transporter ATP-binding protein [Ralstonia sp. 1138]|uniref:ABC transporter ATP-binding protein n=1 Tax=Ralstonia sp. 1138 TaxID=3156423 RepID=UPI00339AF035
MTDTTKIACLEGVGKTYFLGGTRIDALIDIDLPIRAGRFTVISGPSGSGKTTLLNIVGCIDRPTRGDVCIGDRRTQGFTDDELSDFRAHSLGFVFQNFNLLPVLNCAENVEYPLLLVDADRGRRQRRVEELLDAVGLRAHAAHYPAQLSGGQRQRVAIARALANEPKLVLADEPTANLDSRTGASIVALMRDMQRREKTTFVFSSHDPHVISQADDTVHIRDGRIVDRSSK